MFFQRALVGWLFLSAAFSVLPAHGKLSVTPIPDLWERNFLHTLIAEVEIPQLVPLPPVSDIPPVRLKKPKPPPPPPTVSPRLAEMLANAATELEGDMEKIALDIAALDVYDDKAVGRIMSALKEANKKINSLIKWCVGTAGIKRQAVSPYFDNALKKLNDNRSALLSGISKQKEVDAKNKKANLFLKATQNIDGGTDVDGLISYGRDLGLENEYVTEMVGRGVIKAAILATKKYLQENNLDGAAGLQFVNNYWWDKLITFSGKDGVDYVNNYFREYDVNQQNLRAEESEKN